jgi:hypothetical protein
LIVADDWAQDDLYAKKKDANAKHREAQDA